MKNKIYKNGLFLLIFLLLTINVNAQIDSVPKDRILTDQELLELIQPDNEELKEIKELSASNTEEALKKLAAYFKSKFAERYFFDWRNFRARLGEYKNKYPNGILNHKIRAEEFYSKYSSDPEWNLPSKDKNGNDVSAYELRHLARQHKAVDMAIVHFLEDERPGYAKYFTGQAKSLNNAFEEGKYEQEGNDVYEYFRAGYRVLNWLFIHNTYLASENYDWESQILLIKTFLHHAAQLQERTADYNPGNHHTKGSVALSLIAMLFPEIKGSEVWLRQSLDNLTEHLQKEINEDGFQFERSVHYHIGDIDNYFYTYKLAKINHINLPKKFVEKYKEMFEALKLIALPDKNLPVLQDDTDEPWAEYNQADNAMTIGSILFNDSQFKYFAGKEIPSGKYWFLKESDFEKFQSLSSEKPTIGSTKLDETGYYVMRNGWEPDDEYMIISAGLSDEKPDHQHGDMLGVYAYANGNVILPNYQVRYFLDDFKFFKNSFVKNVALADSIQQGQNWKGNSGGSGFGKFQKLPEPKTKIWISDSSFDFYSGFHNAWLGEGINYKREILFIKEGFWVVRDKFLSSEDHRYQQIWQGHYCEEIPGTHLRSTFQNGSGLDIVQLGKEKFQIQKDNFRGKGNVIFSSSDKDSVIFTTLLFPFSHFDKRISSLEESDLFGWRCGNQVESDIYSVDSEFILFNDYKKQIFLFGADNFVFEQNNRVEFYQPFSGMIQIYHSKLKLISFNDEEVEALISSNQKSAQESESEKFKMPITLNPGVTLWLHFDDAELMNEIILD